MRGQHMQIDIRADDSVNTAIAAIGRTEDVHFSPSNTRLAVAGYHTNSILVLSLRAAPTGIQIDSALTVKCPDFASPHGVFWLSDTRLTVANRDGEPTIVDVPQLPNEPVLEVSPVLVVSSNVIRVPGSITAYRPAEGLLELLVCNNSGNYLSRHLLRESPGEFAVISSDIVAQAGLSIPDGVACDPTQTWAAASNHLDHSVNIYRMADFGRSDRPTAVLRGMAYAHGLRFAAGGQVLFVADAGQPFIHVYRRPGDEWVGEVEPVDSIRAVDQDVFMRGRENEQEGGPKGIDLTADGKVLVASCHQQPLAFFDVGALMQRLSVDNPITMPARVEPAAVLMDRLEAASRQAASLRAELEPLRQFSESGYWRLARSIRSAVHRLRGIMARS